MTEVAPARADELVGPRGETVITAGVVAKVAGVAAAEVDGVELASASGLAGLMSKLRPSEVSGASADVASRRTAIDLHLSVAWPRPVVQITNEVRRNVRTRVQQLTGYDVTEVDIVVDALPVPSRRTRRVL